MPVAFTVRGHLIGGEEHAEELAGLQTADNGKPLGMSRGDVGAAAGTHAELGPLHRGRSFGGGARRRRPHGALVVDRQLQADRQLGVDPRPAVGAARLGVDAFDVLEQQIVVLPTLRRRPRQPFVVAGPRHVQHPAGHRDIDVVCGEFTDQREGYLGTTSSLANTQTSPLVAEATSRQVSGLRGQAQGARAASSVRTAVGVMVARAEKGVGAWGSPSWPAQRTRWRGRSGGGPQRAGLTGP